MLLTISTTHKPARDLGYLLHKNPDRCQQFTLSYGKCYVFYPVATDEICTVAIMLDIDPVNIVRGKPGAFQGGPLDQYVNDRPYTASSYLSVTLSQVFGSSMRGSSAKCPELAKTPIPLSARISVLPSRGGEGILSMLFEPLGYSITTEHHTLDEKFPEWGDSPCYTVKLEKETTVAELLTHLYVLIPVLDNHKHYYVGDDEVKKLLLKGEGWLKDHPYRELITRRYLKFQPSLARQVLARLEKEDVSSDEVVNAPGINDILGEDSLEHSLSLQETRYGAVISALKSSGARRVLDLGCGEGKLLKWLLKEKQFELITGMDVSSKSLEYAADKLNLDQLTKTKREKVDLIHGSLIYRDKRLNGYDAAAVIEVVEHFDQARLKAFERVLFEFAKPGTVIITTPNREFNIKWEHVGPDRFRHPDHRFEWTREKFRIWCESIGGKYGYSTTYFPIGDEDPACGPPTQMVIFRSSGAQ